MKSKKYFAIGLISGMIISLTCGVFAYQIKEAYPNKFPIVVNSKQVDIEGYNIDDYSYFKLRDIAKYAGFEVDFKDGDIMINTNDIDHISENNEDSLYNFTTINNIEYIRSSEVDRIVNEISFGSAYFWTYAYIASPPPNAWTDDNGSWGFLSKLSNEAETMNEQLEEHKVPCKYIDGIAYVTREVFENEILARIQP